MLEQLAAALAAHPTSLDTIHRMQQQLDRYESFQYWS